jgi:diketogulonate reductase-like aldo/keto reductase
MLKRPIPTTGEMLPVVGCGTWQTFDVGPSPSQRLPLHNVLRTLFNGGGTVIDSSPMYGRAEGVVGDLVAELDARDRAFIATKVWTRGRDAGIAQMTQSLRFLKASPLDLVQIHNLVDWQTHLTTLWDWKTRGQVRYIGITHYSVSAHADLETVMRSEPIDFVQVNYAMDDRAAEQRLLPLAAERGIAVLVNRPFGEGTLIRRLSRQPLPAFASELGCGSWSELALKYILANEAVTCVIPATRQPEHMASNARAGSGRLPNAELRRRILTAAGV